MKIERGHSACKFPSPLFGIDCAVVKTTVFSSVLILKAWVAEWWELVPSRITELNSVSESLLKEGELLH